MEINDFLKNKIRPEKENQKTGQNWKIKNKRNQNNNLANNFL